MDYSLNKCIILVLGCLYIIYRFNCIANKKFKTSLIRNAIYLHINHNDSSSEYKLIKVKANMYIISE